MLAVLALEQLRDVGVELLKGVNGFNDVRLMRCGWSVIHRERFCQSQEQVCSSQEQGCSKQVAGVLSAGSKPAVSS